MGILDVLGKVAITAVEHTAEKEQEIKNIYEIAYERAENLSDEKLIREYKNKSCTTQSDTIKKKAMLTVMEERGLVKRK